MRAQRPKSIKTDLPSLSAPHLRSCAPCSFWLSVLVAQRPKSCKTDLPSSPSPGLLGGACCVWWPAWVRELLKFYRGGLPSCSFVLCSPFPCGCAPVLGSLSGTPFCPLSGPNRPKRTAPACTLGLLACAPCTVRWSVLASYRPKSFKTDLPNTSTDCNVSVPVPAQARQPHHTRARGGSLSLSLPGSRFVR